MDQEFEEESDTEDLNPIEVADGFKPDHEDSFVVRPNLTNIGRYSVIKQLGRGGFGFVYLAEDPVLRRKVAIKVPRWDKPLSNQASSNFLREGQMLAQVDHPGIVSVFDHGVTDDGISFVVMQFIEGQTLAEIIKAGIIDQRLAINYLIRIAHALQAAHKKSLTHRDLKPSNVIVDSQGDVHLVDFGLALHDDLLPLEAGNETAGTPSWMSPEQVRGENHLIDGQADIWALGVTMYQLLVGRLPFRGRDSRELARAICYRNPKPPRQLNESISRELERICLRCLQKLMDDRYHSMQDVIEELTAADCEAAEESKTADFIEVEIGPTVRGLRSLADPPASVTLTPSNSGSDQPTSKPNSSTAAASDRLEIVPKGLRSFDQNDAWFFLQLLPGPVDRHGLPDSIRFWMSRLDVEHQVEDVPVGLIYGPSGSGKSSFVRAGLLPRLSKRVVPVYVDCTTDDLPALILERLQREIHKMPVERGLSAALREVRLGNVLAKGDKLLLVLDQFEQWLASAGDFMECELTAAIRQCDTENVQVLLLVRDDFWLSASQFFKCLQRRIQESRNAMAIPLLDERHARRVLEAYGRACGALPAGEKPLSNQQNRFVRQAVESLASRGRVICVHLSVFAETYKTRKWDLSEWKSAGGWAGVGREYIGGIFNAPETPAYIRQYSGDAWRILAALLPSAQSDIKGSALIRSRLRDASGLTKMPARFDELMDFLQLRTNLISPIENTEGLEPESGETNRTIPEPLLGLTHDFLVNPIRDWGTAKQNESRQGRAESLFARLANQWELTGDKRFLPSVSDYVNLALFTRRSVRESHTEFWQHARKLASKTAALIVSGLLVIGFVVLWARIVDSHRQRESLVVAYLGGPVQDSWPQWRDILKAKSALVPELEKKTAIEDVDIRFRAWAALLALNPGEARYAEGFLKAMANVSFEELPLAVEACHNLTAASTNVFRQYAERDEPVLGRVRAGIVLAILGDWEVMNQGCAELADPTFRTTAILELEHWQGEYSKLIRSIGNSNDQPVVVPACLYTICCGVACVAPDKIIGEHREAIIAFLLNLYRTHWDAGVHSAAGYALGQWGVTPPSMYVDQQAVANRNWIVLRIPLVESKTGFKEMSFVRLPDPKSPDAVTGSQDDGTTTELAVVSHKEVWVATNEIPTSLFKLFCMDPESEIPLDDKEHAKLREVLSNTDGDRAITQVTYFECVKFCDWIQKHWSGPQDPLLQSILEDSVVNLPDSEEFERANRAGSSTEYPFGDDINLLGDFASTALERPNQMRHFPPNFFGVFDTISGVMEWTRTVDVPERPTLIAARGGFNESGGTAFASDFETQFPGIHTGVAIGFRVVFLRNTQLKGTGQ